jgi:hypothetical protein
MLTREGFRCRIIEGRKLVAEMTRLPRKRQTAQRCAWEEGNSKALRICPQVCTAPPGAEHGNHELHSRSREAENAPVKC